MYASWICWFASRGTVRRRASSVRPNMRVQRIRLRHLSAEAAASRLLPPSLELGSSCGGVWRVGDSAEVERYAGQARFPGMSCSPLSSQPLGNLES
jgi:hypothetical protein